MIPRLTIFRYFSSSPNVSALLRETADTLSQARAVTDMGQSNIAELDTLLDDLNSAQRAGFNREYQGKSFYYSEWASLLAV